MSCVHPICLQSVYLRAAASGGRNLGQGQGRGQGRPLTESDSCIVEGIAFLNNPGETIAGGDFAYACSDATDAGKPGKRLGLTKGQRARLDGLVENGQIIFGETELDVTSGYLTEDGTVTLPNGDDSLLIKKNGNNGQGRGAGRSLLPHTGTRSVLVVRVIDKNGLAHADSSQAMSYNIFGGGGDAVNFKSQIEDCSYGDLTVDNTYAQFTQAQRDAIEPHIEAPGVINVTIPIDITSATEAGSRYDVRNAIEAAVETKLGFTLPGPFADHSVWYNLEKCYHDCGWAAYACKYMPMVYMCPYFQ